MQTPCCASAVTCPPPLTGAQVLRLGGAEECFCVGADGLATGPGVFRTRRLDVPLVYDAGARQPHVWSELFHAVHSDGVLIGLVLVGGLLVALVRRRTALAAMEALAVGLAVGLCIAPFGFVLGIPLAVLMNAGYGAAGVFSLSAAVFALLGFLAGTRWGVRQFRAAALTVTSFVVVTLLIVGLVFAARGSAWAEALDALARLPEPVRTP